MRPWYYREFKPYVTDKKYALHRDDYKYIENMLSKYDEMTQREALRGYLREWNAKPQGENKNASQSNYRRFRANTWLRENYDC